MSELSKTYITYMKEGNGEDDLLKKLVQNPPEVVENKPVQASNFNARKTLEVYRSYIKKTYPTLSLTSKIGHTQIILPHIFANSAIYL